MHSGEQHRAIITQEKTQKQQQQNINLLATSVAITNSS